MSDISALNLILDYLKAHHTMTLATEKEGRAWAASLFYAVSGHDLFFLSEPGVRHVEYLRTNERVAVTVHDEESSWGNIRGVQLEGICRQVVAPEEAAKALRVYMAAFPFMADLILLPRLAAAFARAKFFRLTIRWARLIDNTRGFGWKVSTDFEEESE